MINNSPRYAKIIGLKVISTLINTGIGIILARSLSLTDRGNIATLYSILGILVILISTPRGEEILRTADMPKILFIKSEFSFAIIGLFVLGFTLIKFIVSGANFSSFLILFLSVIFVVLSSINSLLQAFYFHKAGTYGNQLLSTLHVLIYLTLLVITALFFNLNLVNWLLIFLLTEVILYFIIAKFLNSKFIYFKNHFRLNDKNSEISIKQSWNEKLAVYQAAFFVQILMIIASIYTTSYNLAYFAIGMSLVSLFSTPISPFYPRIMTNADLVLSKIRSTKFKTFFVITLTIITYLFLFYYLLKFAIPIAYGQKYAVLVQFLPNILLVGFTSAFVAFISSILRGLRQFEKSSIVSIIVLTTFPILLNSQDFSLGHIFFSLFVSNFVSMVVGIYFLLSYRKN